MTMQYPGSVAGGGESGGEELPGRAAGFDALVARAAALIADAGHSRVVLGICGPPGSGKTTLVLALAAALSADGRLGAEAVAHVPMDGFHLADAELRRLGLLERKGAAATFDPAGYAALLRRLRGGEDGIVYAPAFERDLEQPLAGAIPVLPSARLILTEGNYLLRDEGPWRAVRTQLDETWFCSVDQQARRARLVERHERFGKSPAQARAWVREVDEANAREIDATAGTADLVVPEHAIDEAYRVLAG